MMNCIRDLVEAEDYLLDNEYVVIRPDDKVVFVETDKEWFLVITSDPLQLFQDLAENGVEYVKEMYYIVDIDLAIKKKR